MHGPQQPGFAFDRIIHPVGRGAFFDLHYEKSPLVLHRNAPGYYDEILRLEDVWSHIEWNCPAPGDLKLIKLGAGDGSDAWAGGGRRCDPSAVARMYGDGWTVALNRMHERMPALAAMCAAAEAVFSAAFQANLYLTPPGSQGFMPQWDTHDVFVLQIHGSKDWTLYDTKVELPLAGQSFDDEKPPTGPASASFTLRAGDMLYCPRGLMNSAQSGPEASLHVTFGLIGRTWAELVLEAVSKVFLEDASFRRNLPAGFAGPGFNDAAAEAGFSEMMRSLAGKADFRAAAAAMRDQFAEGQVPRRPGQAGQVSRAASVSPSARAAARPDTVWRAEAGDGEVVLSSASGVSAFPLFAESALRAALEPEPFTVGDLPGPMDADGKAALVRRLILDGLVVAL